ncbi:MAG: GtrA family protein, partial [Polymorphobacter sp.]
MSGEQSRWRTLNWPKQAARFGVVGVLGAGLDYLILSLIVQQGGSPYGARIVSLAGAVVLTWWLNRSLTFVSRSRPSWAEFGRYAAITVTGASIQLVVYWGALYLGAP